MFSIVCLPGFVNRILHPAETLHTRIAIRRKIRYNICKDAGRKGGAFMGKQLGLYIHIPFCKSKCDYCDFYSLPHREERMDAYQKALLLHIKETAPQARGYLVDTIYFGGGTPSYYGERRIRELLALIRRRFEVAGNAEITMEANPESVDRKSLTRLRRAAFRWECSLQMTPTSPRFTVPTPFSRLRKP